MKTLNLHSALCILLLALAVPASAQPSLLGDVQAERAKYGPSMTKAEVAQMLNAVAVKHPGWGLLRKGSGNSCPLGETFISCDILIDSATGHHFDVLIDAENTARPTWSDVGPCVLSPSSGCEMSRFVPPVIVPSAATAPAGVTTTSGTEMSLGPLLARVEALERVVQALTTSAPSVEGALSQQANRIAVLTELLAALQVDRDALQARVVVLEGRAIPVSCSAALNLGMTRVPISCRLQ